MISQTPSHVTRKMELVTAKRDGKELIVQKTFWSVLTRLSVVQTLYARRQTDPMYVTATLALKRMLLGLVSILTNVHLELTLVTPMLNVLTLLEISLVLVKLDLVEMVIPVQLVIVHIMVLTVPLRAHVLRIIQQTVMTSLDSVIARQHGMEQTVT